ncbi:hypothetical protein HaLaN_11298, partial [Haematococcus lacustris]
MLLQACHSSQASRHLLG